MILAHPPASRYELSRRLCEAWNWKQANGVPRDMVCRGLLLQLDRAGAIALPAVRCRPPNPLVLRCQPEPVVPDNRPVRGPLREILPLEIEQVRQSEQEPLFNSLVEQYHYLRYQRPVGEHLKYLVQTRAQAIACLAFSSAPRHLASRDRFIGWDAAARRRNLHLIAYNTRFLILPWVQQAPHLASHILGRMARQVSRDWERFYAHPIHLLETFVDPERFAGTCYRAANWMVVGKTTGRGKDSNSDRPNRSLKLVLVLPLDRRFRELLSQ
ncbi:MAG TPA: DUF4338 domain-containing protein [Terriglobales bacterium]|nr:DUF4338 domain-containing protein [Terriglobales bacterium]